MELGIVEILLVILAVLISLSFTLRKVLVFHWGCVREDEEENVEGKIVVITGAGSGLGFETAVEMAKRGASVIITGRTMVAAKRTVSNIRRRTFRGKLIPLELELSSLESIKNFSKELHGSVEKVDILINNAGVLIPTTKKREKTQDGFEMHFGVNHLSHFYLTKLLLPLLKMGQSSRIVILTSCTHRGAKLNFDDLMFEKASSNISASSESENPLYKASKLANVFFAQELAKRLSDEDINIKVYACCPGIVASNITRHMDLPWFSEKVLLPLVYRTIFKTSSQGCQTILYCALSKKCGHESGRLYRNCTRWEKVGFAFPDDILTDPKPTDYSTAASRRLWEESEKLCGIQFGI